MTTKVTSALINSVANTQITGTITNSQLAGSITADKIVSLANTQITGLITSSQIAPTVIIPSGGIIMWSGSIASIPSGWFLCNGANGTPDLRDRFIVGSGSTYAVGATGGSANATLVSHTHTASVSDPGHQHLFGADDMIASQGGYNAQSGFPYDATSTAGGGGVNLYTKRIDNTNNPQTTGITVSNSTEGSSATNANLPPYYALAFIMKS